MKRIQNTNEQNTDRYTDLRIQEQNRTRIEQELENEYRTEQRIQNTKLEQKDRIDSKAQKPSRTEYRIDRYTAL